MSHYMTALAMKQEGLKPATKIVLYWLADHHNGETGLCCPSLPTLASECEMDKATVSRHIKTLLEMGLIKRSSRFRENGSRTSSEYELSMKQPTAKCSGGHRKNVPTPTAKCSDHNLGNNNLGNEPIGQQAELLSPDPKPSKPKRACQLPDGWVPNERNIKDAADRNFSQQEIDHEADQFRNYHHAKGTTYKNWDAAWRTWLGNARKFSRGTSVNTATQSISRAASFDRSQIKDMF